jgi:predicted pyridoxine 5'-phosphate oxidase superfamily flavin-nucleotide-binding protein
MLTTIKDLIENNPLALATVMPNGRPNVIGVAFAKVVGNDQLLITDNYMRQTITDLTANPQVCIIVWDNELHGQKLIGTASYHTNGAWQKYAAALPENSGLPAKGAILITVKQVIPSA